MSQLPDTPQPAPAKPIDLTSDPTVGWAIFVLDAIACLFWAYTITTLFVFDVLRYLAERSVPDYVWLLDFKVVLFLGIAAFAAFFISKLDLVFWSMYILAFPLVLLFWKIPKHVFKTGSLNIIFYFIFTVIGFFRSLKYNIFASFISVASAMIVLLSSSKPMLYAASTCLGGLLLAILASRIISVLKPGDTFIVFRKVMNWWQDATLKKIAEDTDFRQFALMNPDDRAVQQQLSNVEFGLLSNRVMLFSAKSLRAYQNSGVTAVSGVFVTTFLFVITTVFFTLIYYAVYKIDAANYCFTGEPSGFAFFALSFKAMFFTTINELNPTTILAQSVNIAQNFISLFIGVIFVSIIFTSRNQVLSYQLDETIKRLQDDGQAIECAIFGRYQINSMDELMNELRRLKAGGLMIAEFFTKRL
ncbi:hypothetical protein [Methylobacterium sp. J-092]|uniref:hypothetical protein n=1 Tax=Methylobacterium sp. J-092 TaxID=2836667 RepID=UPI001FBB4DB9|nr:hypothetical protein [Methylobacterium sp. J-092]MCJ2006457.1 hypothetical protein [Methylobacterium sp. J-092]